MEQSIVMVKAGTGKGGDPLVNERVAHVIELLLLKEYSQVDIATRLKLGESGLSRIKGKRQNATTKVLTRLVSQFGVKSEYLLSGVGDPF